MESILELRATENKDWATLLFVFSLLLIVITKTFFESRFYDFIKLIVSDKYIKIYRDGGHINSWFNISLFIVQLISFAFFIQLTLNQLGWVSKTDWIKFIQIITLLGFFVLSKYLIEKIIATTFEIEDFTEQFNLQKVSYRTLMGVLLLPVNIFLFYNTISSKYLIFILIFIILVFNLITYIKSLKMYQSLLLSKMFYFILYLCALEIAPYYFMYYWFTRS
jgi:hypothetical protein